MKLKATLNVLIVFLMLFDISGLYAKDFSEKNIPIQEGGRIKPLDTYARNQTLAFYGKRKINHENLSAIDWILDLVIFPEKGLEQKIFNIRNPDIVKVFMTDRVSVFLFLESESPVVEDLLCLILRHINPTIYQLPNRTKHIHLSRFSQSI